MMNLLLKETLIENKAIVTKGFITMLGTSISFLDQLTTYVRLAGALTALIVGVLTIVKVIMDIRHRQEQKKNKT